MFDLKINQKIRKKQTHYANRKTLLPKIHMIINSHISEIWFNMREIEKEREREREREKERNWYKEKFVNNCWMLMHFYSVKCFIYIFDTFYLSIFFHFSSIVAQLLYNYVLCLSNRQFIKDKLLFCHFCWCKVSWFLIIKIDRI